MYVYIYIYIHIYIYIEREIYTYLYIHTLRAGARPRARDGADAAKRRLLPPPRHRPPGPLADYHFVIYIYIYIYNCVCIYIYICMDKKRRCHRHAIVHRDRPSFQSYCQNRKWGLKKRGYRDIDMYVGIYTCIYIYIYIHICICHCRVHLFRMNVETYVWQTLRSVAYCHHHAIVHRDRAQYTYAHSMHTMYKDYLTDSSFDLFVCIYIYIYIYVYIYIYILVSYSRYMDKKRHLLSPPLNRPPGPAESIAE